LPHLSLTAVNIKAFSIMDLISTLRLRVECHYAECHYDE